MKKIGKLNINPEKVIKNEELITLRGGYGTGCCECKDWSQNVLGYITGTTAAECFNDCFETFHQGYGTWDCLM